MNNNYESFLWICHSNVDNYDIELIEVKFYEVGIHTHDDKTNYKTIMVTISDIEDLIVCVYIKTCKTSKQKSR